MLSLGGGLGPLTPRQHFRPTPRPDIALRKQSVRPSLRLSPSRSSSNSSSNEASTSGGNGDDGGGKSGGGDGGRGRGDGDEQPEPSGQGKGGQPQRKSGILKGWEERVAYDPELPVKVAMEQVIGVGASVVGDMSSRPNWGLNELDFVFSTLVVGSILNFSIMYLLAPTGATSAAGGNMFEPGSFTPSSRLLNLGYKGTVFSAIGFSAGISGTAVSNFLIFMRKQFDPNFKAQVPTWALHMGISANLRYQLLGGLDSILVKVLPLPVFRTYNVGIRAGNNVVGGISFVTLARILGVQKAAEPAASQTA
ncbi:hypothetical protein DUNSADRAFT_12684 [Dunaliella salina]|uniref:Uncharacterized protein n=1 Tax=Dunaliella salina TaxID=3046 RepID=A0ABQ7GAW0_DUNSA|nr:hypothetical protein DUNSADRAFT_12684 [Dunaliella salina]|eukprot:KAF5831737.1 hypothetical protein DUNSADRAFT_12684 [Dunaliella salina]